MCDDVKSAARLVDVGGGPLNAFSGAAFARQERDRYGLAEIDSRSELRSMRASAALARKRKANPGHGRMSFSRKDCFAVDSSRSVARSPNGLPNASFDGGSAAPL